MIPSYAENMREIHSFGGRIYPLVHPPNHRVQPYAHLSYLRYLCRACPHHHPDPYSSHLNCSRATFHTVYVLDVHHQLQEYRAHSKPVGPERHSSSIPPPMEGLYQSHSNAFLLLRLRGPISVIKGTQLRVAARAAWECDTSQIQTGKSLHQYVYVYIYLTRHASLWLIPSGCLFEAVCILVCRHGVAC